MASFLSFHRSRTTLDRHFLPLNKRDQVSAVSVAAARFGDAAAETALRISSLKSSTEYVPVVKMCGITTPEDASAAAKAGANYIGMILWPKSKRSVSLSVAEEIAAAAREQGAKPVGVFVDEDAAEIEKACDRIGLEYAQLHGDGARRSLASLSLSRRIIYVLHADSHGVVRTERASASSAQATAEWSLVDSIQGGSGKSFDWTNFRAPVLVGRSGWFLAGGLNPHNVAAAVSLLKPSGVDVSSGIAARDGVLKDPELIASFIHAVRNWKAIVKSQRKFSN